MYEDLIKSLRWLAFMFPETHPAKDDADRMSNNIHLHCQLAADAIEELRKAVLRLEDESGLYDELPTFYIYPTSGEMMLFPVTVEEFMEQYKVVDRDHAISNGAEFIPLFRMKQWFEHVNGIPKTNGDRLRAMNNEELCDEYFRILEHVLGRYTDSRAGLLEWLKQPAE